jgi:hypothetical protein
MDLRGVDGHGGFGAAGDVRKKDKESPSDYIANRSLTAATPIAFRAATARAIELAIFPAGP